MPGAPSLSVEDVSVIRAAVDTEIAAILAAVDTEVAAILAAVDTEVAAILAAVDTEVAAIKAKTDTIPAKTYHDLFVANNVPAGNGVYGAWTQMDAALGVNFYAASLILQDVTAGAGTFTVQIGVGAAAAEATIMTMTLYLKAAGDDRILPLPPTLFASGSRVSVRVRGPAAGNTNVLFHGSY